MSQLAYWRPNTSYPLNTYVLDGVGDIQKVTTAGTSGSTPPAWTQTTTNDGTVVWAFVGFGARAIDYQVFSPNATGLVQESRDAISFSRGSLDAGKFVLLDKDGQLDTSMGGGGGSTSFASITSGDNQTADMTVSHTAQLVYAGTGIINANNIGGINVAGNVPAHPGQLLISQPGNTSALWLDPSIQGLFAPGSNVLTANSGSPINPVLIGAQNPSNLLANLEVDASGNLFVNITNASIAVTQSGVWVVTANQGTNPWIIAGTASDNTANSTAKLPVLGARANAANPSWTEGFQVPLSVDLSGNLRVTSSGGSSTQYAEGTVVATATGTVSLGKDATNTVHALKLDGAGNLDVNTQSAVFSAVDGAANPANAVWIAASDGTNLRGLQVESSSNKNLKVAIYQGGNEVNVSSNRLLVDPSGVTSPVTVSGTAATNITQVGGTAVTLGQKVSASSFPVVIASDQSRVNTSDAADGSTGIAVPAKAIYIGGLGADGFLHGLSTDNSGVLNVNATFSGTVNPGFVTDRIQSGTITSNQNVAVSTSGAATVVIDVGTTAWTGTLVFEVLLADGVTWISATAYPVYSGGPGVTSTTVNGQWSLPVAGFGQCRVRGNNVASGTATVNLEAGVGSFSVFVQQLSAADLNATVVQGNAGTIAQSWFTKITDGTNVFGTTTAHPLTTEDLSDGLVNTASQPTTALQVAGWDGTNLRALSTTSNGFLNVNASISGSFTPALTSDRTATGTITNTQNILLSTQGTGTTIFNITGSWSGTIVFEASVDGTNFVAAKATPKFPTGSPAVSQTTANGQWSLATGGLNSFRLRGNTVTAGTATIWLEGGAGAQDMAVFSPVAADFQAQAQITDGVNGPAAVKAASTLPVTTDPALVVSLSPNSTQFATSTTANALPGVNPITVNATSVAILNSNANRKEAIIINTGTTTIFLGLGQTPTNVAYHVALAACTAANDGSGGTWTTDMWKGAINAIGSTTGGSVCVTEMT